MAASCSLVTSTGSIITTAAPFCNIKRQLFCNFPEVVGMPRVLRQFLPQPSHFGYHRGMPTPTLTVTFHLVSSSSAITIPGPTASSQPVSQNRRFVTDRAADGTPYTYTLTDTELWTWELSFKDLSLSDKKSLEAFFQEHARGPSSRFTFTHTTGISYTARFAQDQLPWVRNHQQLWDCTVRIETTSEPV